MFLPLAVARPQIFAKKGSDPKPRKRVKLYPKDIRQAIQHAQLVCFGYEDTPSCRVAWDRVEELSTALARQREADLVAKTLEEMCLEDPDACKEFDV
jgi:hypothetical protein